MSRFAPIEDRDVQGHVFGGFSGDLDRGLPFSCPYAKRRPRDGTFIPEGITFINHLFSIKTVPNI